MLEEHVNTERRNFYKMFNLRIPPSKHKYHCSREAPVGEKLLPTNFKSISLCLSSARIFLCIQSCVHTLMEQTMLSQCQFWRFPLRCLSPTGHVDFEIIFYFIGITQWCVYNTQLKSDWLFDTQSSVLQTDWLISESNEKATLYINMHSLSCIVKIKSQFSDK